MKPAVRRAIFIFPFPLWLVTTVALFMAAAGAAKIDADRNFDHNVLALTPTVGLLLDATERSVVTYKPGPVPFCWLCGRDRTDEFLLQGVSHRSGTWLYRAPANDPDLTGWSPATAEAARKLARVLAYDLSTGNTVIAPEGSTIDGKKAILDARGFVADDAHLITAKMLGEWPEQSMMREGCVIVQSVFLIFMTLWLLGWGAWLLMIRRRHSAMSHV